jgi:recombinational DNA repair protein RecR
VCFAWSERGRCLQARAIVDVPAGAELEYTDVNTIAQAMLDRRAAS